MKKIRDMYMDDETHEDICRKLRETATEFGSEDLEGAVIIGHYDVESISNLRYITAPTVASETLGNVDFKVARFFEDI